MSNFVEQLNDLEFNINELIETSSFLEKDSDFLTLEMANADLHVPEVFERAMTFSINTENSSHLVLVRLLIRYAYTLNIKDHSLIAINGIRSYYSRNNDIFNITIGYMLEWLDDPALAYDVFTVLRTLKPKLSRSYLLQLCDLHHEKSQDDDARKALIHQSINDYYFAGGDLLGTRGSDLINNSIITLRSIADKLESLQKITSSLPSVNDFMNS